MKYVVYYGFNKYNKNGGPKMVWDMLSTAEERGYQPFCLYNVDGIHISIKGIICGIINAFKLFFLLNKGDIVLLQFPLNRTLMHFVYIFIRAKKALSITMIHDVDYLRNIPLRNKGVEGMKKNEIYLLNQSDYIIAPNNLMIERLKSDGVKSTFVSQVVSDYIQEGKAKNGEHFPTIIIAGNLTKQKAGYIYELKPETYDVNLYGQGGDNYENSKLHYCGAYAPNEIIENLHGHYGLVWDGPSIEGCLGDYGNYQKYNNPHKLSLYLAASLPVIIWKKAALCSFIEDNGLGFSIESLDEINDKILHQDYERFKENIKTVSKRITSGQYLNDALRSVESMILEVK